MSKDLFPLAVAARLTGARPGHAKHVIRRGWVDSAIVDGMICIPSSALPALASHAESRRRAEHRRASKKIREIVLAVGQVVDGAIHPGQFFSEEVVR